VLLVEKLQFYLLPLPLEGVLLLRRSHRLLQFLLSLVEFFPFSKGVFLILEVEIVLQQVIDLGLRLQGRDHLQFVATIRAFVGAAAGFVNRGVRDSAEVDCI
jgi:hypothetical protein